MVRRIGAVCLVFLVFHAFGLEAHDSPGLPAQGEGGIFVRGDANLDRKLELADAVFALNYLFLGTVSTYCLDALDTTDDGGLSISDPINVLS